MKKFIILLITLLAVNLQTVSAEIQTYHGEGVYVMDKSEPIRKAQDTAFNKAIRTISENVSTYVKSRSEAEFNSLTSDNIEMFAAAVLKVKSKKFDKQMANDATLTITAKVDVEMDTDNVNELLNEIIEARKSSKNYEEVLTDYTKRKNQFDTVYGEYIQSYKKRIMQKLRDGCKLQSDGKLDEALKIYDEIIDEMQSNGAEFSRVYIKRAMIDIYKKNYELLLKDLEKASALNNDEAGMHFVKAFKFDAGKNPIQAAKEYRAFVKEADIIYYDVEITEALIRILELEPEGD